MGLVPPHQVLDLKMDLFFSFFLFSHERFKHDVLNRDLTKKKKTCSCISKRKIIHLINVVDRKELPRVTSLYKPNQ
jgi:hypothetical protein